MTVAEIAVGPDRSHTFKPVSQLGWYTTLLLRFASGSAFIYAAAGFYQLSFLIKVGADGLVAEINGAVWRNDLVYVSAFGLYGSLLIISGVLFLFWVYRAATNIHSVDPDAMTISPRWAVGWNFIPIAWYWKPYQAVKEIWHGSHQLGARRTSPPVTFGIWWGCWVASQLAGHVGDRILERGIENGDILQMKFGTAFGILDGFLFLVAAFLLARIVEELSRTQDTLLSNAAVIFE